MEQFAYLLEKMDAIEEADGTTLLDNTLFTYGSGLGDGSTHQYNDLPIIVAGGGGGQVQDRPAHQHARGHPAGEPLADPGATRWGLELERFAERAFFSVVPVLLDRQRR